MIALTYESEIYMYLRNAQNDIIGLLDKDGKVVVRYTYDSWGQVVKIEGTLKDKVGARNPFRYKGYYYDVETGLYYCRSRYYDPAIRRFISADDTQVLRDNLDMLGEKNLYAYCDDNPITRVDVNGQFSLILWTDWSYHECFGRWSSCSSNRARIYCYRYDCCWLGWYFRRWGWT